MLCLLQQINLYRELLGQVAYQNQLLGNNVNTNHGAGNIDAEELQNMMQPDKIRGFRGCQENEYREPK
jgi:hypothetical protein